MGRRLEENGRHNETACKRSRAWAYLETRGSWGGEKVSRGRENIETVGVFSLRSSQQLSEKVAQSSRRDKESLAKGFFFVLI